MFALAVRGAASAVRDADAAGALAHLGYRLAGDHYEHTENPLLLEVPKGPLAGVGDLLREWETLRDGKLLLPIIEPTDSCRDSLAGFLFWNDRGAFDQAVAVARAQRELVTMEAIRAWCDSEDNTEHSWNSNGRSDARSKNIRECLDNRKGPLKRTGSPR